MAVKIRSLEALGLPSTVIASLERTYGENLLPVQERAIRDFGLFAGESLLVFAPTAAGKTLVAEIAALRAVTRGGKAVLALPTRALVEERVASLEESYGADGLRVVAGTRDRREHDASLRRKDYDIAVVVYEKLASILVSAPTYLTGIGLVAIDELHALWESSRGWQLEWVLRALGPRNGAAETRPQVLGLSSDLAAAQTAGEWLGYPVLVETSRPVPLHCGVLHGGVAHLRDESDRWTRETLADDTPEDWEWLEPHERRREEMVRATRALAQRGERVLCFASSKGECVHVAARVAEDLDEAPAEGVLNRLAALPPTAAGQRLAHLLRRGVAFHHADLPTELRALVEVASRAGELRVLCATSTLAMGVSARADTVLIDPARWVAHRGTWEPDPLSRTDVASMAGRAGRLVPGGGPQAAQGKAMLVAASALERDALIESHLRDRPTSVAVSRTADGLSIWLLRLACQGVPLAEAGRALDELVMGSAGGLAVEEVERGLRALEESGLLTSGTREPTAVGRIAAVFGLEPWAAASLSEWAARVDGESGELEALYTVLSTSTARGIPFAARHSRAGSEAASYAHELLTRMVDGGRGGAAVEAVGEIDEEPARRTILLSDWISGLPTRDVEVAHRVLAGAIARLGHEVSRLLEAGRRLLGEVRPGDTCLAETLSNLSDRLAVGLPQEAAQLGWIAPRGTPRDSLIALSQAGVFTAQDVAELRPDDLRAHVPEWLVPGLLRRARAATRERGDGGLWSQDSPSEAGPASAGTDASMEAGPGSALALCLRRRRPSEVMFRGCTVAVTRLQFDLLSTLAERPGEYVSWDELYEAMWNEGLAVEPAQIGYHKRLLLRRLRASAGEDAVRDLVQAVRGRGLLLNLAPQEVQVA